MSDIRRVARDTKHDAEIMSTAVSETYFFLNELTRKHHRGRGDTLSAARDRAAKEAGVARTYAKRIWDRWETMSDVSGEAYRRFQRAYVASCEHNENKAAEYRGERLSITRSEHEEASQKPMATRLGKNAPSHRQAV